MLISLGLSIKMGTSWSLTGLGSSIHGDTFRCIVQDSSIVDRNVSVRPIFTMMLYTCILDLTWVVIWYKQVYQNVKCNVKSSLTKYFNLMDCIKINMPLISIDKQTNGWINELDIILRYSLSEVQLWYMGSTSLKTIIKLKKIMP